MSAERSMEELVEILQESIKDVPKEHQFKVCGSNVVFPELYIAVESYGKKQISKYINMYGTQPLMNVEDTWQDFCRKRLLNAIKRYDPSKGAKFTSWVYLQIKQQCIDVRRNAECKRGNDDLTDDFEKYIKDIVVSPETGFAFVSFFKRLSNLVNGLNTGLAKILAYHCKILLGDVFQCGEKGELLAGWSGSTLANTANGIDCAYTKVLDLVKSEGLMDQFLQRLEKKDMANDIFVGPKEGELGEWVRQIKDHLKKHHEEMTKLKAELIELIF